MKTLLVTCALTLLVIGCSTAPIVQNESFVVSGDTLNVRISEEIPLTEVILCNVCGKALSEDVVGQVLQHYCQGSFQTSYEGVDWTLNFVTTLEQRVDSLTGELEKDRLVRGTLESSNRALSRKVAVLTATAQAVTPDQVVQIPEEHLRADAEVRSQLEEAQVDASEAQGERDVLIVVSLILGAAIAAIGVVFWLKARG